MFSETIIGDIMQIPLEVSFRNVDKTPHLETLIREKVSTLEKFCGNLTSCSIAVERPNSSVRIGNPYRVRIDITVPGHEIVVSKEQGQNEKSDPIPAVIREAFEAAKKQLNKLMRVQRNDIKTHPEQQVAGIINKLFLFDGYGFIRTINGRDIYFHKNSILNKNFEELKEGDGVRFFEEDGEKGPQASTIQII